MACAAHSLAFSRKNSIISRIFGASTLSRIRLSIRLYDRLLISSLVHAKWTNSETALSSGFCANFSLIKYSTAFTSWLVVRSISLMWLPSSSEKSATIASICAIACSESGATSSICGWFDNDLIQANSTSTRARIKPNSLAIGRSASTLDAYRPSIGEIAVRSDRFIVFLKPD